MRNRSETFCSHLQRREGQAGGKDHRVGIGSVQRAASGNPQSLAEEGQVPESFLTRRGQHTKKAVHTPKSVTNTTTSGHPTSLGDTNEYSLRRNQQASTESSTNVAPLQRTD